ncbi:MAG: UDP-N-acetylmuramoyl-tripeptide--D-alanyl-D-alanine ligase [Rickettsiales bacterium]
MSALWAVADLVRATGGVANGEWCAWRVEIDSRKVRAGDIFVAIKGEQFDGHDYVVEAFKNGAIAAIVERSLDIGGNQLVVDDALVALADMARYNRKRCAAKIVGVTGSVGKTSTKDMLSIALAVHGKTYVTSGNFNNHIGLPLSLTNMPIDTQYAVFEMGMNHAGEILYLTEIARPDIAVVSCVEAVHMEFFDSVDDIAKAKAEIFEGLAEDGVAIINADQLYFSDLDFSKITFGKSSGADLQLLDYKPFVGGCEVHADILGNDIKYKIGAIGYHFAVISLSVLAVCNALGLDIKKSAAALAAFSEARGRGEVAEITVGDKRVLLINDSYNASPVSMRGAFAKTSEVWQAGGRKGRKIAFLGDMLELGKDAGMLHKELADTLRKENFDKIYAAGDLMHNLYDALPENMRGAYAENIDELSELAFDALQKNDVVLIKGSHGSSMYKLAEEFLNKYGVS